MSQILTQVARPMYLKLIFGIKMQYQNRVWYLYEYQGMGYIVSFVAYNTSLGALVVGMEQHIGKSPMRDGERYQTTDI